MKALLILNPGSRSGKGQKLWNFWIDGLKSAKIAVENVETTSLKHTFHLAHDARAFDTVIVAGGDGTINRAIDGIVQSGRDNVRFGVLYSGTSPDFCKFHGIPLHPEEAIKVIAGGKSSRVDVGEIEFVGSHGERQVAHFSCSSNVGMGAIVARRANTWRKSIGDFCGTGAAVISAIAENRKVDLELEIDGQCITLEDVNNLFILKNPFIASGLKLNIPLEPADGQLMVVAIHGKSRLGLGRILPKFYSGSAFDDPQLFSRQCTSIIVRSQQPQELEFDGDPRGWLPVSVQLLPGAIDLIGA